ncbi:MAG TPA: S9 family peptidase [Chthonomonadales bacterium]|nr:S9 family peptidase [Chthonomonadales bacterium]
MPSRPIELEDLLRFRIVGDTRIAPDGARVAFTVRSVDTRKNRSVTSIWMARVDAAGCSAFTGGDASDSQPRWSPDGERLAFVSDRRKPGSQLYLIPAGGGEAQPLTEMPDGAIDEPAWSPDGTRIAFRYRRTPEEHTEKARKAREESGASQPVRTHTRLFYRLDGSGYTDGSWWQVWVVDVATREARPLTEGPWHHGAPAWSPDGERIAFVANRREDADLELLRDTIYTVPASGGEMAPLQAPEGPKGSLAWSPDGRWIAMIGHTDPDDAWGCRNDRVLVIPAGGAAEAVDVTGATDKAVGYLTLSDMQDGGGGTPLAWSPDSRVLYFAVSELGDTRLYRAGADGSALAPLTPAGKSIAAFSVTPDERAIAVAMGDATTPHEVWAGSLGGAELRLERVSRVNDDLLAEAMLQAPATLPVTNPEGGRVHTWELRPPGFRPEETYPCVLYVHGGPALQYGGVSTPFHELQWLAANGYVVVFGNPRGSKGYGEAHTSSIRGDWGSADWVDIEAIADHAASLPYVDAERMAIMGGSYGGFMTAWAIGHTNRFRCAIADRLVANLHSMSGTCDFPWAPDKAFGGNAWDDPSRMWRSSPLHYAGAIETPLLLIHSDGDLRCPVGQAEELFAALRWQRRTVELARYPAETSHGLSRNGPPDMRLDRLRRNLDWLDRWLKPAAEETTGTG